jgi:hypothetical protein
MVRPLNKMKGGKTYTRRPEIEACINVALGQDLSTVLKRAAVRNVKDPDYMPMECLLHLAREARLRRDKDAEGKLLARLLIRCEARLLRAVPDGGLADAAGKREDILQEFGALFARVGTNADSTILDYYEVNFDDAFRVLRWGRLRRERARAKHIQDLSEERDEDGNLIDEAEVLASLSRAAQSPAQQEDCVYLGEVGEFVATLPPGEREAVRLVAIEGHKIESEDADEVTAATLCGVTGRAIRKRLASAAKKLKQFQQES